jgi:hypothetical protein
MSHDPNKRQVRILDAKTGQYRMSEPMPMHAPRQQESNREAPAATDPVPLAAEPPAGPHAAMSNDPPRSAQFSAAAPEAPPMDEGTTSPDALPTEQPPTEVTPKPAASGKQKQNIETLEQFIQYAYARKGQRVTLNSKVERLIAQNPRLDDGALSRLKVLAEADTLLAVPRELLLLSREIEGLPALRAAMNSFVSTVMLRHTVFANADVQAALRNLPEAPPASEALVTVLAYAQAEVEGKDALKPADLQALRRNAAHLLATWLAGSRGLNADDIASLLFQAMWAPAARELGNDNARLRALTEVEQPGGVGLACQRFRQQAIEARTAQDRAQHEAGALRRQVAELDANHQRVQSELEAAQAELTALRESTAAELGELRKHHEIERVHLRHGQEQLRGRLVRSLEESLEMLEVGLTALRNKTPRVEVMVERAEHVVDALRAETTNLKGSEGWRS